MARQPTRLTPGVRNAVRVAGVVFAVFGILKVGRVVSAMSDPWAMGEGPGMGSLALGGAMLMGAVVLLRLGFLGVAADILVTETETAVRHAARSVGDGLAASELRAASGGAVMAYRCATCGELFPADEARCARCGGGHGSG